MSKDKQEKRNKKKVGLVIILLLLLLIPFSCTTLKKESTNGTSKNHYIEDKPQKGKDEDVNDYSSDEEILEEETIIIENEDIEVNFDNSYSYRKKYANYSNKSNTTQNSNENTNNSNNNNNTNTNIKDLVASLSYSTHSLTYKTVTATITANKELEPIEGWNLSSDKKTLTKEYAENKEEVVTVKDKDGKTKILTVSIRNISSEEKEKVGTDGEFKYIVLDKGQIQIIRYLGNKTDLTIPSTYDGYKVYSVGNPKSEGASHPNYAYNIFGENTTTNTSIKSVTIEKGVKVIEVGAFNGCSGLTGNLIIPEDIISLKNFSFSYCTNLNGKLVLPSSLKTIEMGAFYNCTKLTGDLVIPENVKYIGNTTFGNCKGLNGRLILPIGLVEIARTAFANCSGLTGDLIIPEGLEVLGDGAFQNCSGFNGRLSLPTTLKSIGEYAFNKCSSLVGDLIIPEGVEIIAKSAFQLCSALNGELILPSTLKEIGGWAFYKCTYLKGKMNIPKGVTSIGDFAFNECRSLTGDLHIPEGVISIGNATFQNCTGLRGELTLPSTLESIGNFAFNHCEYMSNTSLTIPKSVKQIGSGTTVGTHVFYNFASIHITEFKVEEGSQYFKAIDGVLFTKDGKRLIQYPTSKLGNTYVIPEGVEYLDQMAFSRAGYESAWCSAGENGLRKIILPDSFVISTSIPNEYTVENGNSLETALYRYTGVNEIGVKNTNPNYKTIDGILYSKDGTTLWYIPTKKTGAIALPEGLTTIKEGAVYAGYTIGKITLTIPKTVNNIDSYAIRELNTMGTSKVTFDEGCIYQFNSSGRVVKVG